MGVLAVGHHRMPRPLIQIQDLLAGMRHLCAWLSYKSHVIMDKLQP